MRAGPIVAVTAMLLGGNAAAQTAQPTAPMTTELPPVEVIGASPLIGSGIDRNTVPAETQVLNSDDLTRQGTPDLVRSLNQQVGGVVAGFRLRQSLSANFLLSRLSLRRRCRERRKAWQCTSMAFASISRSATRWIGT